MTKIYILPIPSILQPSSQPFTYPAYNQDYGVEQDFLNFLNRNSTYLTTNPNDANWHYLPVYWTRWHLNHDFGKTGLAELRNYVMKAVLNAKKTFTVCQYDDGPLIKLPYVKCMYASRKNNDGIDIPLLASRLPIQMILPYKKYLATFNGRLSTHPIRKKMKSILAKYENISIEENELNIYKYQLQMHKSYIALCPRGYGGSSFRFYEAMQLGVVPILIGNIDTRPFKTQINWDEISFYCKSIRDLKILIDNVDRKVCREMGRRAKKVYWSSLAYQKWCTLAIRELK